MRIGDNAHDRGLSVLGEGVTLGAGNMVTNGARLFPGVDAPRRRRCASRDDQRLDAAAVAAVDSTGQAAEIARPGRRTCATRCGAWTPRAIAPVDAPGGLIVAGMGGSAIGGRLAAGALGGAARAARSCVADDYELPAWTGPETLVLCSSYSGATEETLAATTPRGERGAPRLVATTGGAAGRARAARPRAGDPAARAASSRAPRSATRSSSALEAAALAGAAPSLRDEVEAAAALAERARRRVGARTAPEDGEAKALARRAARHDPRDRRRRS